MALNNPAHYSHFPKTEQDQPEEISIQKRIFYLIVWAYLCTVFPRLISISIWIYIIWIVISKLEFEYILFSSYIYFFCMLRLRSFMILTGLYVILFIISPVVLMYLFIKSEKLETEPEPRLRLVKADIR